PEGEAVGNGADPGRLPGAPAPHPAEHGVILKHRADDARAGALRPLDCVGGEQGEQVRAAPEVARAARLGDEGLDRPNRQLEVQRHGRTSTAALNRSRGSVSSRSRKAWTGFQSSGSGLIRTDAPPTSICAASPPGRNLAGKRLTAATGAPPHSCRWMSSGDARRSTPGAPTCSWGF